ncbi:putative PEP-binding protein, partial [Nitrosococcus oceani]
MSSHPGGNLNVLFLIRYTIFLTQVRASLRAAEGLSNLNLLFPMISAVSELEEALHIVRRA